MQLKHKSNYSKLTDYLGRLRGIADKGRSWAEESAAFFEKELHKNLKAQGRSRTPKLTSLTLKLYRARGNPNGSGIRRHIRKTSNVTQSGARVAVGILAGKPSLVARVQDRGAMIRVTPKMRGWMAINGVFLKQSTKVLRVPGRGFWRRALAKSRAMAKRSARRLMSR
jgi:hypothetical protein